MPDIYGSHFEYAGTLSRKYGLIIANVETTRYTPISGSISGVTAFNKSNKRRYLVDTDYSESTLSFDVDIITDTERCLDISERREIERWLFNKHNYQKFYIDPDDDCEGETFEVIDGVQKRLYLNCRFINPEKLEYNGGVIGYRATLEADSSMWWQDAVTKQGHPYGEASDSVTVIDIEVDTDIDDYTYPLVVLQCGMIGGDIVLRNTSDTSDRTTILHDVPPYANIRMNGELNLINGEYYTKLYHQNFPRLVNGKNRIVVEGNATVVTYTFNNRRRF
jgi:phage-related protein